MIIEVDVRQTIDAAHEGIRRHPYPIGVGAEFPGNMTNKFGFGLVVAMEKEVLRRHTTEPIDVIVGDDISGRIPTLITHRFLRLAEAAGHIETVPRTIFLASGSLRGVSNTEETNAQWSANLNEYTKRLVGSLPVRNALIITEVISSGKAVGRLEDALLHSGVESVASLSVGTNGMYLHGTYSEDGGRPIVGVEKYAPEPVSRIHPKFNGSEVAKLRHFVRDYTDAVYTAVLGEDAPSLTHYKPSYSSGLALTKSATIKSVPGAVESLKRKFFRISRRKQQSVRAC